MCRSPSAKFRAWTCSFTYFGRTFAQFYVSARTANKTCLKFVKYKYGYICVIIIFNFLIQIFQELQSKPVEEQVVQMDFTVEGEIQQQSEPMSPVLFTTDVPEEVELEQTIV